MSLLIVILLMIGGVIGFAVYQFRQTQRAQRLLKEADTAMRLGNCEDAITKFDAALATRLNELAKSQAFSGRGYCLNASGRLAEAARDYTEVIRLDPKSAWTYQARGLLRAAQGDANAAFADYSEAIRLQPNSGEALHGRGLISLERRESEKAIADFREAIRVLPDQASLYSVLSDAQMQKNDWAAALVSLDSAIRLDQKLATAYVKRAEVHRLRGDWEKAVADDARAHALKPVLANPPLDSPAALEHYDRLLAGPLTAAQASDAYACRGTIYLMRSDLDHAIRDFDQAIIENSKNAGALINRALAYNGRRDWAHSIPDFEKGIALNPPGVELALNSLAWLRATNPDRSLRDGREAVELATKACELTQWRNAGYIDTLAAAHAEMGDFDKAIETQRQAVALLSVDARIRAELESRVELYRQRKPHREK